MLIILQDLLNHPLKNLLFYFLLNLQIIFIFLNFQRRFQILINYFLNQINSLKIHLIFIN